jgi:lysophospholipase L1-like esterase
LRRGAAIAVLALVSVTGMLASGCSGGSSEEASDAAPAAPPETYVAVGASESVGVGAERPLVDAWPRAFYRTAVDRNTVFVSLGVEGSTVAEALDEQLPLALELRPTLVTVWLNVNDLAAGVPVDDYRQELTALVRGLRQDGRAQVLVANTPPVDQLPLYEALAGSRFPPADEVRDRVADYNRAIEQVADAEGADLVDLYAAGIDAVEGGTFDSLVAEDGFHPSTEGHTRIAEVFAGAM